MRIVAVLGFGLIAAATLSGTARAADLAYPLPATYAAPPAQQEFGTGWYLRGDVGWSDNTQAQIFADVPALTSKNDWNAGVGAGYRWNSWFRTDLTANFDGKRSNGATGTASVICPYTLQGVTRQSDGTQLGYLWSNQAGTCNAKDQASLGTGDLMANAYIDMGTWWGLTPYVGAGVGVSYIQSSANLGYNKTSDGSPYTTDLTASGGFPLTWVNQNGAALSPQPTVPTTGQPVAFGPQNWSRKVSTTRYNFAWALQGGVAYAVDSHLSVDVGYRYLSLGKFVGVSGQTGNGVSKDLTSQQVRVGLRYAID